jgi:hypothetical protein
MKSIKRILIIDEYLPYLLNGINKPTGGASVQTYSWYLGFKKLGYKLYIGSSLVEFNNDINRIVDTSLTKKHSVLRYLFIWFKLLKVLLSIRPNLIYISTPFWSNIFVVLIARFLQIKVIQRISNDNVADSRAIQRFGPVKSKIYLQTLKYATHILCQNDYQLEHIKKRFSRKKVTKLTNPFMPQLHKAINDERSYIAWIGLFQRQKNMPALYTIIKRMSAYSFKVAGTITEFSDDETKKTVEKLSKLPNVSMVGLLKREEILDFLSHAHCLLNTSHFEGFSNTYLESFSVGTAVVTRKETDPDLIILKHKLGKSVDSFEELPDAINDLICNPIDPHKIQDYLTDCHNPELLCQSLINQTYENI